MGKKEQVPALGLAIFDLLCAGFFVGVVGD